MDEVGKLILEYTNAGSGNVRNPVIFILSLLENGTLEAVCNVFFKSLDVK